MIVTYLVGKKIKRAKSEREVKQKALADCTIRIMPQKPRDNQRTTHVKRN